MADERIDRINRPLLALMQCSLDVLVDRDDEAYG